MDKSRIFRSNWRKIQLLLFIYMAGVATIAQPQQVALSQVIRFRSELNIPVNAPEALAVTSRGDFYVTDPENNRIVRVSQEGNVTEVRGQFGWQPEEFDYPADIVLAQNLNLYVADYYNQRLQHYDRNLNFIRTIPLISRDESVRYYPKSVDQAADERIYVLDAEQNQLLQLNQSGDYVRSLATFSEVGGELTDAAKLRVSPLGDIWVLSPGETNVYRFDRFGTFKRSQAIPSVHNPVGIGFFNDSLAIVAGTEQMLVGLGNNRTVPLQVALPREKVGQFTDAVSSRQKLYVLCANPAAILVFSVKSPVENE